MTSPKQHSSFVSWKRNNKCLFFEERKLTISKEEFHLNALNLSNPIRQEDHAGFFKNHGSGCNYNFLLQKMDTIVLQLITSSVVFILKISIFLNDFGS